FDLVNGTSVIFEAADDSGINNNAIRVIPGGPNESLDFAELMKTKFQWGRIDHRSMCREAYFGRWRVNFHSSIKMLDYVSNFSIRQTCTSGEIAAIILSPLTEQSANAIDAQPIELIDCAHNSESACGIRLTAKSNRFEHTI